MASPERNSEIFPSVQSDLNLAGAPYRIDFDAEKFGQSLRNAGASDEQISSLSVVLTKRPEDKIGTGMVALGEYLRDTRTINIYAGNLWHDKSPNITASEVLAHETKHSLEKPLTKAMDRYCRLLSLAIPMTAVSMRMAYMGSELGDGIVAAAGAVGGAISGVILSGIMEVSMISVGLSNYTSPMEHRARRYAKRHKKEYTGIISMQERDS